jgi:hypothetical protein
VCQNFCFHSVCSVVLDPLAVSGEAENNTIIVNGVAPPDTDTFTETEVAGVNCTPVGKEKQIHSKFIFICQVLLTV